MAVTERIRNLYASQNVSIQEKAVSLFILDVFIAVGFAALGILRIADRSIFLGSLEITVAVVLAVFVFLLLKKRFKIVSIGNVIIFSLAAAGLFFLRDITSPNDVYIQATYMIPAFITLPLLAYARWQVIGVVLFGIAAHSGQFFLRIRPVLEAQGLSTAPTEYFVSLLLMVFTGVFIFQIFRMQQQSLKTIQEKVDQTNNQYTKLHNLMEGTGTAFNLGERLLENAENNRSTAGSMADKLERIRARIEELSKNTESAMSAGTKAAQSKESVKATTENQTSAVGDSSAATEELRAQVEMISNSAKSRQADIEDLVKTSEIGAEKLGVTIDAFRNISRNSESIIEIIDVIEGIADRTNLLAMNAAIEAAHAGESGKGFAVVAEEIRKLAEESNENARYIRTTLQESDDLIKSSVKDSEQMQQVFSEIIGKITNTRNVLLEIIAGMEESARGHEMIEQSVEHLSRINEEVNNALTLMEQDFQTSTTSIGHIQETTHTIEQEIGELASLAEDIVSASDDLKMVGRENIESFKMLAQQLEELR